MVMGFRTGEATQYNGRITSFVLFSCTMAAIGGALFGYDTGISGGVTSMESFLKKFFPKVYAKMEEDTGVSNYCKFNSQLLTSFTSSLYVAGLIASFFASSCTRDFGRKPSILIGGAAFLFGAILGAAAINVYMLILGRVLLGIGVGFGNQSVPLYLSEMAPPRYRGAINNGFQLSVSLGVLSANLVNYGTEKVISGGWGWRISLGMAAVPAIVLILGSLFLPETPNSLLLLKHTDGAGEGDSDNSRAAVARQTLQKLRGTDDVQAELDDLIRASESAKSMMIKQHPCKRIMEREYRPQLVMSIAIPLFQQVTGINVIAFYAPILFRMIGLEESSSLLSAVVTGAVGMFATLASVVVVDKLGRRVLFITGGIQMFISQVAIGTILALKLGDDGEEVMMSKGNALVVLFLICLYVAAYGLSWGPLGWLVPSEIFPLEIRSVGQSITVAVNFLFTFVIAQSFLAMLCRFKAGIFFFFGGWVAVMTGFVYAMLPETKNVPIEQMKRIWKNHWFWGRIMAPLNDRFSETAESLLR